MSDTHLTFIKRKNYVLNIFNTEKNGILYIEEDIFAILKIKNRYILINLGTRTGITWLKLYF